MQVAIAIDAGGAPVIASSMVGQVAVTELDRQTGARQPGTEKVLGVSPLRSPPAGGGRRGFSFGSPVLATGPEGQVAVAWMIDGQVQVAVRSADGAWGRAARVSRPGSETDTPRVAVGTGGRVAVTWDSIVRTPSAGHRSRISSTVWVALRTGTGWGPPARLSGVREGAMAADVGLDGLGRATVVWSRSVGPRRFAVASMTRGPQAVGWSAPVLLSSPARGPLSPAIATNAEGGTVATWARCVRHATPRIEATSREQGGPWSAVAALRGS